MLNYVLNCISIYYFSLYIEEIRLRDYRNSVGILWGGEKERKKINLASWIKFCKPKKEGRLRVKHNELFNLALLSM